MVFLKIVQLISKLIDDESIDIRYPVTNDNYTRIAEKLWRNNLWNSVEEVSVSLLCNTVFTIWSNQFLSKLVF